MRNPSGRPEAELWIGAHDLHPSSIADGTPLNEAIIDAPLEMLGGRVCDIFGDRLPFLMKVLAVDQPLSLQVHPSSERARIGHSRENHEDVPVDAPDRNYKDPWHKPELHLRPDPLRGHGWASARSTGPWRSSVCCGSRGPTKSPNGSSPAPPSRRCAAWSSTFSPSPAARSSGCCTTSPWPRSTPSRAAGGRRTDHRSRRDPRRVNREAVRVFEQAEPTGAAPTRATPASW